MKPFLRHKLIIFYGSSPGAGKSTLSSYLCEQLRLHGISVRWIYEEDVLHLEVFQESVQDIQCGNHKLIDSLLDASMRFVEAQLKRDGIVITDSIFPCFDWLIATGFYSYEQIEAFGKRLEHVLRPLNPFLIYLDIDQQLALSRAVEQRGQKWLDDTLVRVNRYGCHQETPLQSVEDVASYFKMAGDQSMKWLMEWKSDHLILDATNPSISELKAKVLERFALEERQSALPPEPASLQVFTGVYAAEDEEKSLKKQLIIEFKDTVLKVNAYWPKGCELVAEGDDQFRLKDTSHHLRFERFQDGIPQRLAYHNQSGVYRYRRIDSDTSP